MEKLIVSEQKKKKKVYRKKSKQAERPASPQREENGARLHKERQEEKKKKYRKWNGNLCVLGSSKASLLPSPAVKKVWSERPGERSRSPRTMPATAAGVLATAAQRLSPAQPSLSFSLSPPPSSSWCRVSEHQRPQMRASRAVQTKPQASRALTTKSSLVESTSLS